MSKVPRKSRQASYKGFCTFRRNICAAFTFDTRDTAQVAYPEPFDKPVCRCSESDGRGHRRTRRAWALPHPSGKGTAAPNGKKHCRTQQARALHTRRRRARAPPYPTSRGTAAPDTDRQGRRRTRRESICCNHQAHFPQVNERLDRAPSKLAGQLRHKRENETATASDPRSTSDPYPTCERARWGDGFANSPRQEPFILSLGGQNERFFATE